MSETLPQRILGELRHGPSYGVELARRLGVRNCAAAGALTSLRRRGFVVVDHEEPAGGGTPRRYYALAPAPEADVAARRRRPRSTWRPTPGRAPEVDLATDVRPLEPGQSAFDVEVALLRASVPASAEILECIYANGPVRGL